MPRPRMLGRVAALVVTAAAAMLTAGCLLVPAPIPAVRRPVVIAPPVVVAPGPYYHGYRYGYGYHRHRHWW